MIATCSYEIEVRGGSQVTKTDASDRRAALENYSEALSGHLAGGWQVQELLGEASVDAYRSGVVLRHPDRGDAVEIWFTETALRYAS